MVQLGTVQTWTGKVDPARKFKSTTAARDRDYHFIYIYIDTQYKIYVRKSQGKKFLKKPGNTNFGKNEVPVF